MDADRETEAPNAAFEWAVRVLYAVLIFGNVLLVYDAWKDTAQGIETRARFRSWWEKAQNCEGCARRKAALRRATDRMHFEAAWIVENAREEEAGSDASDPGE